MLNRILVTVGVLLYGLGVPLLEINDSHVFNPHWLPHARLHEVWQLMTNSAIGAYALWLVWCRQDVRLPSLLALFVTGGFLAAYALQDRYGGSMLHVDGSEKTVLGINIGVLGFGLVVMLSLVVLWRTRRRPALT